MANRIVRFRDGAPCLDPLSMRSLRKARRRGWARRWRAARGGHAAWGRRTRARRWWIVPCCRCRCLPRRPPRRTCTRRCVFSLGRTRPHRPFAAACPVEVCVLIQRRVLLEIPARWIPATSWARNMTAPACTRWSAFLGFERGFSAYSSLL